MKLNDDIFYLECDFSVLLPFMNSQTEKMRVLNFNKKIKSSFYPLTKSFLQDYYLKTNYSHLKKSFKNVNCAADVYSYFVQTYGMPVGTSIGGNGAASANSSGLNPFFGAGVDLGFNLGSIGSWLWLFLLGAGFIYLNKK
jgi:hypothetical protein